MCGLSGGSGRDGGVYSSGLTVNGCKLTEDKGSGRTSHYKSVSVMSTRQGSKRPLTNSKQLVRKRN